MHQPADHAPDAKAAAERLRPLVATLPEATEGSDKFGHITFRVRDKPFVFIGYGKGAGSLAIKCDLDTQRFLMEHRPFHRTPYIGQHGWASVDTLPPDDWEEVEALVTDAYRLVAPRSLLKEMDSP